MSDTEDIGLSLDSVFTEAPRPPSPEATVSVYNRDLDRPESSQESEGPWSTVKIRLVGSHPLWGHHLWNAALAFASYLDHNPELYRGRCVLELGAGGGLPGIVTAKNGAKTVVLTDYPDASLIDNLEHNVAINIAEGRRGDVHSQGYIWGQKVTPLLELIQPTAAAPPGFDLIIMSDLIFNHSQHDALLKTCDLVLAKPSLGMNVSSQNFDPCLLVFYTHHRPHLAHRDLDFFVKARDLGWRCTEILTKRYPPMFPEDPGEEEVRATVHGWKLTRMDEKDS
ncbi:hypothetical protein JAAARDRAFT_35099 [Jaapia argillacea MUCL 33604]|uniref:Protein N-terminal and lysine N-methyltransferase EFM7 n=1 Tax=Jaapia argillacea MUCL 33604 TaxID=933084 RepID=A0A067PWQ2_9AGAM|nr:hypothetical protein JAAARDRAFT_35099 [Jaapia argillacea MUCL 33604]